MTTKRFDGDFKISPIPNTDNWIVLEPFVYHLGHKLSLLDVEVPMGFITDLASIPWYLRWLLPRNGKYAQAAVVHDYMIAMGLASTRVCDAVFEEACADLGVNFFVRHLMYGSLRIAAWFRINKSQIPVE